MQSFYKTILGKEGIAIHDLNSDLKLTYEELNQRVISFAKAMSSGANGEGVVAIDLNKTYEYLVAQLACSYLNKPFLSLDKNQTERNIDIINDIKPEVIIKQMDCFIIDDKYTLLDKGCEYVVYSSGSTGKPKGIILKGKPAIDIVSQQAKFIGIEPQDKYLWLLNTAFDASLSDIYSTFVSGATLVIPNFETTEVKKLVKTIQDYQINYIDLPPSMFKIFLNLSCKYNLSSLKAIVFGGETAPQNETLELSKKFKMIQAYGPTETTICSSMNVVNSEWVSSDIGAPMSGVEYQVEDNELLIAGDVVCLGYFNNDLLNETRFIKKDGKVYYKTGDVVEIFNGKYLYKGRKDRQFKLHSQLICPEEIEVKAQLSGATFAHISFDEKIVLFYQGNLDKNKFEKSIATYMKPNKYILLEGDMEKYLNANMKINHKALKDLM